jgi:predicted dehydrogenase
MMICVSRACSPRLVLDLEDGAPPTAHRSDLGGHMRLGLVGYGVGGRYFHAPFMAAAQGVELAGVVTRSPERRAELAADFPGVPAHDSLADLLAAGVDAVTITTPPRTRRELVLQAVAAGVPTIADKPFAPDAAGGRELVAAAKEAGVPLNVFHNRRWDADIRTLAAVLRGGELGELWRVESRMDQDNAATLEVGPDAGLLRDLGSHLVDQVLWLLGPARAVYAELDFVGSGDDRTDCRFTVSLTHAGGARSQVSASKVNHIEDRELRAYGSAGSYVARGTDVQAQAVFAGRRPVDEGDAWGYDAPEHWGTVNTAAGSVAVPSEQGAYQEFYRRFAAAVRGDGEFPVPAEQAVHTLEVLDAARLSAAGNRVVELPQG